MVSKFFQYLEQFFLLGNLRPEEFCPGVFLGRADFPFNFLFQFSQFLFVRNVIGQDPLPEFQITVMGALPFQSILGFVAFVRTRCGMPLWLCEFLNVN